MLESTLISAAQLFGTAARRLETFKAGSGLSIALTVAMPGRYDREKKPTLTLEATFHDGTSYQTVKADSLATLIDEVYHRCGFADKSALAMDTTNASIFEALEDHTADSGTEGDWQSGVA